MKDRRPAGLLSTWCPDRPPAPPALRAQAQRTPAPPRPLPTPAALACLTGFVRLWVALLEGDDCFKESSEWLPLLFKDSPPPPKAIYCSCWETQIREEVCGMKGSGDRFSAPSLWPVSLLPASGRAVSHSCGMCTHVVRGACPQWWQLPEVARGGTRMGGTGWGRGFYWWPVMKFW